MLNSVISYERTQVTIEVKNQAGVAKFINTGVKMIKQNILHGISNPIFFSVNLNKTKKKHKFEKIFDFFLHFQEEIFGCENCLKKVENDSVANDSVDVNSVWRASR